MKEKQKKNSIPISMLEGIQPNERRKKVVCLHMKISEILYFSVNWCKWNFLTNEKCLTFFRWNISHSDQMWYISFWQMHTFKAFKREVCEREKNLIVSMIMMCNQIFHQHFLLLLAAEFKQTSENRFAAMWIVHRTTKNGLKFCTDKIQSTKVCLVHWAFRYRSDWHIFWKRIHFSSYSSSCCTRWIKMSKKDETKNEGGKIYLFWLIQILFCLHTNTNKNTHTHNHHHHGTQRNKVRTTECLLCVRTFWGLIFSLQ